MDSMMARDSSCMPRSRMIRPPCWKPFSMAIPTPSKVAPDSLIKSIRPITAQPFARKSSMMRMWSSGDRNFFETMISNTFFLVKDSTLEVNISPSKLMLAAFLANTTGTLKHSAATQAIPIPEASMVRILLIGLSHCDILHR